MAVPLTTALSGGGKGNVAVVVPEIARIEVCRMDHPGNPIDSDGDVVMCEWRTEDKVEDAPVWIPAGYDHLGNRIDADGDVIMKEWWVEGQVTGRRLVRRRTAYVSLSRLHL